jgi:UDP-glucose 4-epimerase
VEDLARAHVLAMAPLRDPGVCRAYNLGCGGHGYSVREVIDTAVRVTGRPIPERKAPRRPGDPPVLIASSTRIERELRWRAEHRDLESIVRSAWDWMQERDERSLAPPAPGSTTAR